jgi:hypothetical protein
MRIISKIDHAYRRLWSAFYKVCGGIATDLKPTVFKTKHKFDKRVSVLRLKDTECLQIKGWPYSSRKSGKKMDIFIELSNQEIKVEKGKEPYFTRSDITVTYLKHVKDSKDPNQPSKCNLIGVVRYDFIENQEAHPVFHTHIGPNPIDERIIQREYLNKIEEINKLRIPTPPMDLKAVLIGLVADTHFSTLRDLVTNDIWKNAEADFPIIPTPGWLIDEIKESQKLESKYWYNID